MAARTASFADAAPSARPPAHRLFFALFPEPSVRERMALQALALRAREPAPRGRWVAPERFHLTLRFLGHFDHLPDEVVARARVAAERTPLEPVRLRLDHVGSFEGRRPPWVLRCSAADAGLLPLWELLGRALADAGVVLAAEPAFAPHVTLMYSEGERLERLAVPAIDWVPADFALAHSVSGDPAYRLLGRWRLPS